MSSFPKINVKFPDRHKDGRKRKKPDPSPTEDRPSYGGVYKETLGRAEEHHKFSRAPENSQSNLELRAI